VVVPTYHRPDALTRCLDALARQEMPADEVVVVARVDDEASIACVEERGDERVRLAKVEVPPGRPGFVVALNAGIATTSGDLVCLTDDDAEPWPDWLARVAETFASDPSIGAVGGRDWVYQGDRLDGEDEEVVGTVAWWGRVVGRHHVGVGPARDVAILKGVNLCARGDLLRAVGFDTRLLGVNTEHHSELGLCLALGRTGYRIVYDPAIAVDHRPAPRAAEARGFGPRQVRDSSHNETLALLEHLSPAGKGAHLAWSLAIGSRGAPGLAQAARSLVGEGDAGLAVLKANLEGRRLAIGTYLRSRRSDPVRRSPPASGKSRLLAIAHSSGARVRAEQLLDREGATILEPGPGMGRAARAVLGSGAAVLYLVDVGKTTAVAAILGRLLGKRVIVDTGDACFALSRSLGDRSFAGLLLIGLGEWATLRCAHRIVVRGRAHADLVPGGAVHIPDVAPPGAGPVSGAEVRVGLDLEDRFVVGLVGSLILSPRLGVSYGWDLVESLPHLDAAVVALIVGDGSGRGELERRARQLNVVDRCRFVGAVASERVSEHVGAMDATLSTQTNDVVGQVRTTGKLPLYLACGRPVLASHVGEAARVLGPLGWTIPYRGRLDRGYPARLAAMIEAWRVDPDGAGERQAVAGRLSAAEFDVATMRERLAGLIDAERAAAGGGR
jgi:glycosyltransferase involved in cell wall biosynthesis